MAERRERGEASAKACGEQQAGFVGKVEPGTPGIEQSDEKTAGYVYAECGPRKQKGGNALMEQQLHAVAEKTAGASAQENEEQGFRHKWNL